MECRNCKHWQGTRASAWGDCYRVVARLEPNLIGCVNTDEETGTESYWTIPFDPHDEKSWRYNEIWSKLFNLTLLKAATIPGLRIETVDEMDILYLREGGMVTKVIRYPYFVTHKNFNCKEAIREKRC